MAQRSQACARLRRIASATSPPTIFALAFLSPSWVRRSPSMVGADASVPRAPQGIVAETLNLAPSTVGTHLYHVKQKLGANNQSELTLVALRWGLIQAGLPEIVSFTVPPNLPSQEVMQRIGMRYDGTFEHPRGVGQWWGPHVLYRARAADLA